MGIERQVSGVIQSMFKNYEVARIKAQGRTLAAGRRQFTFLLFIAIRFGITRTVVEKAVLCPANYAVCCCQRVYALFN